MKGFKSTATREEENHARMAKPRLSPGLARHFFHEPSRPLDIGVRYLH
jgi:hypothetical protein